MSDPLSYPVSVMSYRNRRAADWKVAKGLLHGNFGEPPHTTLLFV